MKLPDFKTFPSFNALKDRMGIPRHVYGDLRVEIAPGRLTLTELTNLASPAGTRCLDRRRDRSARRHVVP